MRQFRIDFAVQDVANLGGEAVVSLDVRRLKLSAHLAVPREQNDDGVRPSAELLPAVAQGRVSPARLALWEDPLVLAQLLPECDLVVAPVGTAERKEGGQGDGCREKRLSGVCGAPARSMAR